MKMKLTRPKVFLAIGLVLTLLPALVRAEVTRVEITRREDVLGAKPFGAAGAYEKLVGKVSFAVDPANPHNKNIANIDKAPKNKDGKVEFSSDLYILKPKDPSKGNGITLFDVSNRGGKGALNRFNRGTGSSDPTSEADFGDGLLMRQGFTVVNVGWQFDVRKYQNPMLVGLDAPIATDNGKPITGWVSPWWIPDKAADSFEFTSGNNTRAYPPLDPKDRSYRLTEREGWVAAPRLIPREDWQFGRMQNGQVVYDPNWLHLEGGFRAGQTYQLTYQTKDPPVAGLGFVAIRDFAAAIKSRNDLVIHAQYTVTYGESQVGRFQRTLLYDGFTTDEKGKRALDGMFIHIAGASFGSFNEPFAVPNELGSYTTTWFPLHYQMTVDPVTGKRDGLSRLVSQGEEPKIFLVDTSSEYWDRGRVAALRHVSMDGTQDLPDPPNVRIFTIAGTKHIPGVWPPAEDGSQQLPANPNDQRWAQRALIIALALWVKEGVAPNSLHPQLSDGTLVDQTRIKYPDIAGVQWPFHVPGGFRADLNGPISVLPFLVPQVDTDGNETGGIRLPEEAVPLGTYSGWAFRSEKSGAPTTLIAMAGSYIPFARTRAERESNKDPRPSVEERYPSRADYLRRIEETANKLALAGYLLQQDVKPVVDDAGKHWDMAMSSKSAQAGQ
jgi:hypothetical protein